MRTGIDVDAISSMAKKLFYLLCSDNRACLWRHTNKMMGLTGCNNLKFDVIGIILLSSITQVIANEYSLILFSKVVSSHENCEVQYQYYKNCLQKTFVCFFRRMTFYEIFIFIIVRASIIVPS
jgi:hypothetical protein